MSNKEYIFDAIIKESHIGKGGAYIEFPYDVITEFETKGRVPIICFFDDIEYIGSLMDMGTGCHIIGMKKDIRTQLNKRINDTVHVRLVRDTTERTIAIHPLLLNKLQQNAEMKAKYEALSFTKQKEINLHIVSAKKEETRLRRLDKIIKEM